MKTQLPLFSAFGVELEYMIVDNKTLSVCPISDRLIHDVTGEFKDEVIFDSIAWSNELVLHVLELKTNGPSKTLSPLSEHFQQEVKRINALLEKYEASLLPTGAHPWMNPHTDALLWPHHNNEIYDAYHKIFDCRGHGWSNLQSVHLNLPFANDTEFAKLHTAIRLILPILPAISASTPIIEGSITGLLDTRLEYYRLNQQKIPSVTGVVIPELVFSEKEYQDKILLKMYQEIAPFDHNKILQEEWLNSRGAIARFDRNTIEIRVLDTQECPEADLAILNIVVCALKALVDERWQPFLEQTHWTEERLHAIFLDSMKYGLDTILVDEDYPKIFGLPAQSISLKTLWQHILEQTAEDTSKEDPRSCEIIELILKNGNLAQRIITSLRSDYSRSSLQKAYQALANCLNQGELFLPCEN